MKKVIDFLVNFVIINNAVLKYAPLAQLVEQLTLNQWV